MKKVLFAAVAVLALASCKKTYTCTVKSGDVSSTVEYPDLNKAEAETAESACKSIGGTWSTK